MPAPPRARKARRMQRLGTDEDRHARNVAPANRIVVLEVGLRVVRSENAQMRKREADLRAELERVQVENSRLRAAFAERRATGTGARRSYAAREMTAGTSVGRAGHWAASRPSSPAASSP
jgi:hypothetical protein